jgi:hypothetical protein
MTASIAASASSGRFSSEESALARLEAAIRFVDHIGAAAAADDAAIAMTSLQGLEAVPDLHVFRLRN